MIKYHHFTRSYILQYILPTIGEGLVHRVYYYRSTFPDSTFTFGTNGSVTW